MVPNAGGRPHHSTSSCTVVDPELPTSLLALDPLLPIKKGVSFPVPDPSGAPSEACLGLIAIPIPNPTAWMLETVLALDIPPVENQPDDAREMGAELG